ncbi:MAG: hypothetical protein ACKVJK_18865 [Methylophagaceae bacterium]
MTKAHYADSFNAQYVKSDSHFVDLASRFNTFCDESKAIEFRMMTREFRRRNPNFKTITFKSITITPNSLPTSPPKSKLIEVRKKSFTTLSGRTNANTLPKTLPKIAPIKSEMTIMLTLRFCKIHSFNFNSH